MMRCVSRVTTANSHLLNQRGLILPGCVVSARLYSPGPKHPVSVSEEPVLDENIRNFLDPAHFYRSCLFRNIDFFTGVPDSLLKDFCAYVTDTAPQGKHVITANEGAAVSLAAGYHLATKKIPMVYMQNSGFGNVVNPLMSLTDRAVYSIPMILLIGWRGEPGKKDEPQHIVQGQVMPSLLTSLGLPYEVLPDYNEGADEALENAFHYLSKREAPYCFLVKRATFSPHKLKSVVKTNFPMHREDAIKEIVDSLDPWDVVVATTGMCSRELYEYRTELGQDHSRDFLTVGSMGHASAIALGISMSKPSRQIVCLDGDGGALMHLGTLTTIGSLKDKGSNNFRHIILNNGAHDSVGGQPTVGLDISFEKIALGSGYVDYVRAETPEEVRAGVERIKKAKGPSMLEVLISKGARANLGRPKEKPVQNKQQFMEFLRG